MQGPQLGDCWSRGHQSDSPEPPLAAYTEPSLQCPFLQGQAKFLSSVSRIFPFSNDLCPYSLCHTTEGRMLLVLVGMPLLSSQLIRKVYRAGLPG